LFIDIPRYKLGDERKKSARVLAEALVVRGAQKSVMVGGELLLRRDCA
jgi:hypothetical protein